MSRLRDIIGLEAFLFGGVPNSHRFSHGSSGGVPVRGPVREYESGPDDVIEIIRVNLDTGEISYHEPAAY